MEENYLIIRLWVLDCYIGYCENKLHSFNKRGETWSEGEDELGYAAEQYEYFGKLGADKKVTSENLEYWTLCLILDAARFDSPLFFDYYATKIIPFLESGKLDGLTKDLPAQENLELRYDLSVLGFIEDKGYSDFVPTMHYVIEEDGEYPVMRKPLEDERLNLFTIRAWVLDYYYIYCRQKLKRMKDHSEKWQDGERELDYACAQFDETILKRPIERVMLYVTYLILDANRGSDSFRETYRSKIADVLQTIDLNQELAQLDDNERLHFESDLKVLKLIEATR